MIPIRAIRAHKNYYAKCCRLIFRGMNLIRWRHCDGLTVAENKRAAGAFCIFKAVQSAYCR